ncbi:preprotein translocase subunit SecA [Planctomycetes bacterium K23_9]|uniref:Preprotein translocase subunit SecA n=1 Tax=Stieleria marina TaxID=1930275 RepID=A0A517NVP1_9BACT|nr:preprotein translocase subunit SecA [Planctomycetes bacterium K23_9]
MQLTTPLHRIGNYLLPSRFKSQDLDTLVAAARRGELQWCESQGDDPQEDAVTDKQLADEFAQLRTDDVALDEKMVRAAALGSAAVRRTMGFSMHDVQLKGALATARGAIIEMQTGEGKTVVSGVAAVIRASIDESVHVATTTDYLAERDHEAVEPIFALLGLTSAALSSEDKPEQCKQKYQCDIVYGPGYAFGFDYLRDQLTIREFESLTLGRDTLQCINGTDIRNSLIQTTHPCIIVDEADSVLIDEAATPLILSGSETYAESAEAYTDALHLAFELEVDTDYTIDFRTRQIELTDAGRDRSYDFLKNVGRLDLSRPWTAYVENALFAQYLLVRDEHYVIQEDEIALVDQLTGRIFDDRTLRGGLHQAVEAKETLTINPPTRSLARITRQRFFQMYDTVCGMTGTASGSEAELLHFYKTPIVPLPPNVPCKRIQMPTRFFDSWDSKCKAIVVEVQRLVATRRPILIGTRTIRESVLLSELLGNHGIIGTILNGVQDDDEAQVIAKAGQPESLMIATNMAGRGTDIKLSEESRALGGLHVLATSCNSSHRVDRQLAGRSARQGDPGSCQFFVAADDDLFQQHGEKLSEQIKTAATPTGESPKDFSAHLFALQQMIERVSFDSRCKLVQHDNWMDSIRETMV